jgi:hypothetical protein
MDVEVGHSIGKYLIKLERLNASIYTNINLGNTGVTEEMATMIAKRLPRLTLFFARKSVYYSEGSDNKLQYLPRLKYLLRKQ